MLINENPGKLFIFNGINGDDKNSNGILDGCEVPPVPGDINGDDAVNVADLLAVINAWGPCSPACAADLNADGVVNVIDLLILIENWG